MSDNDDHHGYPPKPDYEVGYGRPPKDKQFKPGRSGNPKGRRPKPNSVQVEMRKVLSRKIQINEGGTSKRLPIQEVILRTLANKAAKGDLKAADFVFRLSTAPEFSDTDIIDQGVLSSEDQAMLDAVMRKFAGPEGADCSVLEGSGEDAGWEAGGMPETRGNGPAPRASDAEDRSDDG